MRSEERPTVPTALFPMSRWIAPAAGVGLFAVLTWPIWRWLWGEWMANNYYSHGVLIVPVALYLAWRRLANGSAAPRTAGFPYSGIAVLVVALGAYLHFHNERAYYLAAFAAIGLLVGLVWTWAGTRTVRMLAFPLAYLTLMVPLPFIERVTYPLALLPVSVRWRL